MSIFLKLLCCVFTYWYTCRSGNGGDESCLFNLHCFCKTLHEMPLYFIRQFVDHGGVKRIVALTREKDPKQEKPLRTYSQRVILAANRVSNKDTRMLMKASHHSFPCFMPQCRNERLCIRQCRKPIVFTWI